MPHTISVEHMFVMPKIHLSDDESLWLSRGRCVESILHRVQALDVLVAQGMWQERQLGLVTADGSILRVNPSIASMRTAQLRQSK